MVEDDLGEFPPGWEQRVTSVGLPYFVDHVHRTTTFEDPRIAAREKRRKEACEHESSLPQYKRDIRRKLLKLRALVKHRQQQMHLLLSKRAGVPPERYPALKIDVPVSRSNVFEDSYRVVMKLRSEQLVGKLNITFNGEEGLDYGGIAREWFYLLSRDMLNPYYGLFQQAANDQYLLEINPCSSINPDHISYFRFIGRVLGLALAHGHYVDGCFVPSLFKLLLGRGISVTDMEKVDPTFHTSLVWMLENDITGHVLGDFTADREAFGVIETVELKPGGQDILVTEENKHEYVRLMVRHRLLQGIADQIQALTQGFNEVVPRQWLDVFDERELELMLCGLGAVDIADWRANTDYRNCDDKHPVVSWFWGIVDCYDDEMRARLLQFVTGTSRVPATGFGDLRGAQGPKRFTIELVPGADETSLPKAHTCFNRIDLPRYKTLDQLEQKLSMAVDNTVGFGIE